MSTHCDTHNLLATLATLTQQNSCACFVQSQAELSGLRPATAHQQKMAFSATTTNLIATPLLLLFFLVAVVLTSDHTEEIVAKAAEEAKEEKRSKVDMLTCPDMSKPPCEMEAPNDECGSYCPWWSMNPPWIKHAPEWTNGLFLELDADVLDIDNQSSLSPKQSPSQSQSQSQSQNSSCHDVANSLRDKLSQQELAIEALESTVAALKQQLQSIRGLVHLPAEKQFGLVNSMNLFLASVQQAHLD
jgi:hypothetical protein